MFEEMKKLMLTLLNFVGEKELTPGEIIVQFPSPVTVAALEVLIEDDFIMIRNSKLALNHKGRYYIRMLKAQFN